MLVSVEYYGRQCCVYLSLVTSDYESHTGIVNKRGSGACSYAV